MAGQSGSSQNAHVSMAAPHLEHFLAVVVGTFIPSLLQREQHPCAKASPPAARPRVRGVGAFSAKSRGHPVELARHVVVHLAESQALEPPRGPRGHVSSCVPAVDDHRSRAVQDANSLGFKAPEWKAYRTGKVVLLVLVRR